jgi:hypothetical protein
MESLPGSLLRLHEPDASLSISIYMILRDEWRVGAKPSSTKGLSVRPLESATAAKPGGKDIYGG